MVAAVNIGVADRSLSQQIYDALRSQIIDGTISAGTWLRERDLADQFNVSRIPLREALPQLELDGFITMHPRRGAVVRTLTIRDAEEMFEVRASLEVLVARLAATRASGGASTVALRESVRFAADQVADGTPQSIASANAAIHAEILTLADNDLLSKMMAPLNNLQAWIFGITTERDQRQLCEEHQGLFEAISEGNVELADSLAFAHVERSRRESIPLLATRLAPRPD